MAVMEQLVTTGKTLIQARKLCKQYGAEKVVNEIDLDIQQGECFGLLGPNGAGKTTTLRMFLGMTIADSGTLSLLGFDIPQQATASRQHIGVVPQMDNLDPDFTVVENLRTYANYFGYRRHGIDSRLDYLLGFANLEQKAHASIDSLSGGMKRRLTLARALVNDPQLLILDEPTTGLDPQARQMIWQRLRQLKNEGRTLILTTHYMEEAQRLCDRIAIMDHGHIIAQGSPAQLMAEHVEAQVLEVYGNELQAWIDAFQPNKYGRTEKVGETLFIYTDDERPIVESLCQRAELTFLHRRANLEDVFLKLTGRDLRE